MLSNLDDGSSSYINPFTATACKISGLKRAHIHSCKQYSWWSCNKSTFSTVLFDRSPFTCPCEGEKKTQWFQIWQFYWSFSEWRHGKHGSERVKDTVPLTELMDQCEYVTVVSQYLFNTALTWIRCKTKSCILTANKSLTYSVTKETIHYTDPADHTFSSKTTHRKNAYKLHEVSQSGPR